MKKDIAKNGEYDGFELPDRRGQKGYRDRKMALQYTCNPIDKHRLTSSQWQQLNGELNRIFDLGMDKNSLWAISHIDTRLGEVDRFWDNHHLPFSRSDNTAAHCKQVMNLVDHIFLNANKFATNKAELDEMRKDAISCAMIHDMGEIIAEGTTVAQVNAATAEYKKKWAEDKNRIEPKIFAFFLMLLDNIQQKSVESTPPPHETTDEYWFIASEMRGLVDKITNHREKPVVEAYPALEKWIEENAQTALQGYKPSPWAERLIALYDVVEHYNEKGDEKYKTEEFARTIAPDFKHIEIKNPSIIGAVTKTLERVEGSKYFQRYMSKNTPIRNQNSRDFLGDARRCEKSIDEIFSSVDPNSKEQKLLAVETAKFTYKSISRLMIANEIEPINNLGPDVICLDPKQGTEAISAEISEKEMSTLDKPAAYITREMLGCIYKAAASCVDPDLSGGRAFIPTHKSLIDAYVQGELSPAMLQKAKEEWSYLNGVNSHSGLLRSKQ